MLWDALSCSELGEDVARHRDKDQGMDLIHYDYYYGFDNFAYSGNYHGCLIIVGFFGLGIRWI